MLNVQFRLKLPEQIINCIFTYSSFYVFLSNKNYQLWLNIALLDLPVQPSTEVLGFGHSSAAAAQHLPFRFYDHARRSSSDTTVQRSVFASVDKVPGKISIHCQVVFAL